MTILDNVLTLIWRCRILFNRLHLAPIIKILVAQCGPHQLRFNKLTAITWLQELIRLGQHRLQDLYGTTLQQLVVGVIIIFNFQFIAMMCLQLSCCVLLGRHAVECCVAACG